MKPAFIATCLFALLCAVLADGTLGGEGQEGLISATVDASKMESTQPMVRVKPLPEGDGGIASKHPGDAGIGDDPAVLFTEDFEEGAIDAITPRWTASKNEGGEVFSLSDDAPLVSEGRHSLEMTATRGRNNGGYLWKRFTPGVDAMYARAYVKFAEDHPYVHHFVKIGGWRDAGEFPLGEAGYKHDGTKSFQTGLEPTSQWGRHAPPGAWFLYTYWADMKSYQGPAGKAFYGNAFLPKEPQQVPRGKWQCVEFMVKLNSAPERHDGEQAFWIDGKLAGRWAPNTPFGIWVKDSFVIDDKGKAFEGFRWRTAPDLKINTFWLLYYMQQVFDGHAQFRVRPGITVNPDVTRVWFDDLVIATEYIGPIRRPGAHVESTEAACSAESTSEGDATSGCRKCHSPGDARLKSDTDRNAR